MAKVILQGYIQVPDEDLVRVKVELKQHIELTRAEPGCLTFKVWQEQGQSNRFEVYEEFTDRDAFAHHQQRIRGTAWEQATVRVERHYEISEHA